MKFGLKTLLIYAAGVVLASIALGAFIFFVTGKLVHGLTAAGGVLLVSLLLFGVGVLLAAYEWLVDWLSWPMMAVVQQRATCAGLQPGGRLDASVLAKELRKGRFKYTLGDLACLMVQIQCLLGIAMGVVTLSGDEFAWAAAIPFLLVGGFFVVVLWYQGVKRLNVLAVQPTIKRWAFLWTVHPNLELLMPLGLTAQVIMTLIALLTPQLMPMIIAIDLVLIGWVVLCRRLAAWIVRGSSGSG